MGSRPAPACTTRGRLGSSSPGSEPMPTAWTNWTGCSGRRASSARCVGIRVDGLSPMIPTGAGVCRSRTTVTAGTLFDRRRTPLTVRFTACWMFAAQKDGVSALSPQRSLEIGFYPTAWAMLHRLRSVLVRPGRDRLTGTVEADETYIGGEETGVAVGGPKARSPLSVWQLNCSSHEGTSAAGDPPRRLCRLVPMVSVPADTLPSALRDAGSAGPNNLVCRGRRYRPVSRPG
jgi:hypothetical protein